MKESEKKDKYLDLARELKKAWNKKVTVISIVIGVPGWVTKGLIKGLKDLEVRGQVETSKTSALLRSDRILRRVLDNWGDSSERPSVKADVKNLKRSNNNNDNKKNNNLFAHCYIIIYKQLFAFK